MVFDLRTLHHDFASMFVACTFLTLKQERSLTCLELMCGQIIDFVDNEYVLIVPATILFIILVVFDWIDRN